MTITVNSAVQYRLEMIQAALAGASALLDRITPTDAQLADLWSAKKLVDQATDHACELVAAVDDVELI